MIKSGDRANRLDVSDMICLPYDFQHEYGTRAEVLDASLLSLKKIAEILG
jgi:hypothetical protein